MAGKLEKKKVKKGVCEIHKYALAEEKKCSVRWDKISSMWICKTCDSDVVLQAMATTGRKQQAYFSKINKKHKN